MSAQVIEINVYAERAQRIRALLQDRAKGEAEIAGMLRKGLDELGEVKWVEWCKAEFGWARTSAYRHLDPKGMDKHRATGNQRSHDGDTEPENEPETEETEPESLPTKKDDLTAYLVHAEQARRSALISFDIPTTEAVVRAAKSVVAAWAALVVSLEAKQNSKLKPRKD